ncbi:SUKH-4 family immunity protein [Actinomadura sp. B10D3]|uniref:SUKH-4 family immunity protein n=1 Tax=Actinomadura sp. B10D3 TaxID=3153557 RepID=UPI00325ECFB7
MTFRDAGAPLLRAVDLVGEKFDPGELDPYIAGLEVVGHLLSEEQEAQAVVRDVDTGRVFSLEVYRPDLVDLDALAPSVEALHRMVAVVAEAEGLRGRFADLAGHTGTEPVKEALQRLVAAFREEGWGPDGWGPAGGPDQWPYSLPTLWRIMAVIKPMALIASPGRGLRLDLPAQVVEDAFGVDGLVRFAPENLPAALSHEPTRRFLSEVGLPADATLFFASEAGKPLRTVLEYRKEFLRNPSLGHLHDSVRCNPPAQAADHLFVIGDLAYDLNVVLDGRTGEVHHAHYTCDQLTPLNADVSTLAFAVWMYAMEQELRGPYDLTGDTGDFYHHLADTMVTALATFDPVACLPSTGKDDFRYWPETFHDAAGGVL